MAEVNKTASAASGARSGTGFELRLERGGASVRLADRDLAPGLRLDTLSLQIPDVRFPFDVGQGAAQFRHRLSDLASLEISVTAPFLDAALAAAPLAALGIEDVRLALRDGFVEIAGRIASGPDFTLEAGLLPEGDRGVRVVFHAPRLYGPAPLPAAALPHLATRLLAGAPLADPVPPLLRAVLAPRGWKLPRSVDARLARAEITGDAVRIAWDASAPGPSALAAGSDLLAADEGARAFAGAEAAVAAGDPGRAREALLAAGPGAGMHPFAAERLLSLFVLEDRFHEEALDLAADWLGRRPGFAPALLAEAHVRLVRGEEARAARALAELAAAESARGAVFAALAAAEAVFRLPGAGPDDAHRAVDVALGIRRDHVPALRALRALAAAAGDRETLLRADRRLVAYDPDDAEKARAHAELGELLLSADPPAARLHLDQALRLAPEHPSALGALARACAAAGEPLRAVRALDRLAELHRGRGEPVLAARAAGEAGALWEGPLAHPENALLRYRAAAELAPAAAAFADAARAAEAFGQWAEAADHHAAALAALDPAAPGAAALAARTRRALADVAERRLGDPAAAAAHLEAAAAAEPGDAGVLRRLAGLHRSVGDAAGLARALERLAVLAPVAERGALLAEAGEALLAAGRADDARARFGAALAADPASRPALLGLAGLARDAGDTLAERDALARLVPLAADPAEAADLHDRFSAASERAGDLAVALAAARAARGAAPTSARLEAEVRLTRRAGDGARLAALLDEAARAALGADDATAATAAWLERARLLAPADPAGALAALAAARAAAPGDAAVLRAQADLAERTGDARVALVALRALLAVAPTDAAGLGLRAARAALAVGELSAAREHAEAAHAAGAEGAAGLLDDVLARTGDDAARAALLARLGRPAEAAPLFEKVGDPERALAAWEAAADDPAHAPAALARLTDLRLSGGDARGAALALLARARLAGGREGARLALRAHALDPDGPGLEVAAERDPTFAPARARRAALRAAGDPRGALEDAEAALGGDELAAAERPALLALAAGAAAAAGDGAAARRHLAAYCDAAPDDDAALARLGALQRRAGEADALAATLARRLPLAAGADAAAVRIELSDLLAEREPARAAALAEEALDADPALLPALRALLSPPRAAHARGDRGALLARLAAHPAATAAEAAFALAERARRLDAAGDLAGALDAARDAARRAPPDAALLDLVADLAARAGDAPGAAGALLARAALARDRGEDGAADRLAEAGLAALAAGLAGAEDTLADAVRRGPEPEGARAARAALVDLARGRGDAAGERVHLAALVPLLPTGERPAALLRLAGLARDAGDAAAALAAAEAARTLAPRDPIAVEAALAAAEAAGDPAAVADRLLELAALRPAETGSRLAARARLLEALGRFEEADDAWTAAAAALPPERGLAEAQARLRAARLPARPPSAPLERFAQRRAPAGRAPANPGARADAARALRAGAALALAAGDTGAALRCARRAFARTQDDLAFAGPLLARVLYLGGASGEALVVHRRLLDAGLDRLAPEDALAVARELAELAEDAGERDLALAALAEVLARRPQDLDAAVRRAALDPDRPGAARALAAAADRCASDAARTGALAHAAEIALADARDPALADALFRRARAAAGDDARRLAALARHRAEALHAAMGSDSGAFLEALRDSAAAAQDAGDRAEARALYAEATVAARAQGRLAEAAQDLLQLDALAAAEGDLAGSAERAREAGALLLEAGDLAGAAEALRRAAAEEADPTEALRLLEEVARAQGGPGAALLAEVLEDRAERSAPGAPQAAALLALAEAHAALGDDAAVERDLLAAVAADPDGEVAATRLSERLRAAGRELEAARRLLELADWAELPTRREALRREAAGILASSPDAEDRGAAADALAAIAADRPDDLAARRGAAALLTALGRRDDALPHLAAVVRADPDDDAAATALAEALADRHADRAELFLLRAGRVAGEARAARLHDAAKALFAGGEDARARAALRDAFDAWPADAAGFVTALRDAATDVERLDAVLTARAAAAPAEASSCHLARADALLAFGEEARALAAYEAGVTAAPDDPAALAALAGCLARVKGDAAAAALDAALVTRAAKPGAVLGAAEAPARYRLGLAAWAEGKAQDAVPHLERALALAPSDERAGIAWAALAHGHAARGDASLALAAARSRAERARALGLAEERRVALEAGADLALSLGARGADAAELLEGHLHARLASGEPPEAVADLARHAADALSAAGDEGRAAAALACAGLAPPPAAAPAFDAAAVPAANDPDEGDAEPTTSTPAPVAVRADAQAALERAFAAVDPVARAAALVEAADDLARGGAPAEELRPIVELACETDPDAAAPWQARARIELAAGDVLAAARAFLSIAIRAEGDDAAAAALEAARLFEDGGCHADAARAYRAAVHAKPGCAPARTLLAEEALSAGDAVLAADHLAAIPLDVLAPGERGAHTRRLARTFEAAGRAADAEALWTALAIEDPTDAEAFAHAAALAEARSALETWLDLAQRHEQALGPWDDPGARRDLRFHRGRMFAAAGRLEEARRAYLSALELDPVDARTLAGLAELDDRDAPAPPSDPVAAVLRGQALAADGVERAELFERLAGHIERTGDVGAAADALLDALDADPERDLTWSWFDGLVEADPDRRARGAAIRARVIAGEERSTSNASATASPLTPTEPPPDIAAHELGSLAADFDFAVPAPPADAAAAAALDLASVAADATAADAPPDLPPLDLAASLDAAATPRAAGAAAVPSDPPTAAAPISPAGDDAFWAPETVDAAARGREHLRAGAWEEAHGWLAEALARDPTELTVARDLSRVAEKLGRYGEYVELGEVCADAIAAYDPLAAAARYRHFAEVLAQRLDAPERAAVMLEKALALAPTDPDTRRALVDAWASRPETAPRALDAWLEIARSDPSDADTLARIAALCARLAADAPPDERTRLAERGRLAASLAAFASPSQPTPQAGRIATQLPGALRARVAAPGATSPAAALLGLLAPWLEPLFPADLARRGAGPEDQLAPERAPALAAALDAAGSALAVRPYTLFLTARPGLEVAVENTQPPSIVLSAGVAELLPAALAFLAARTLDLVQHGWALAGKFAPRDVSILLELACRFAGAAPPSFGLPEQRAGAFLAALEAAVPPRVRHAASRIAASASDELSQGGDPRSLAAALRRTANRVALLYTGDPGEALRVLARLDPRLESGPLDVAHALSLPDLRDLALFALSDPFLDLRLAALG